MKNKILRIIPVLILGYVGVTTKYETKYSLNLIIQYIVISILSFGIVCSVLKNKEKILNNKLDIFLLLFSLTPILSIIFNKVASVESSIMSFIKYIMLFEMYLIIKYLLIKDSKYINTIINTINILSIILILIGIDKMTYNTLNSMSVQKERLDSIFGYANTLAAMIGTCIFLNLGQLVNSGEKKKIYIFLQVAGLSIQIVAFILTYSRFMYVIFIVLLICYLYSNKELYAKRKIILVLGIDFVFGLLYSIIYNRALITGEYYIIYIGLIIEIVTSIFIYIMSEKYIVKLKIISNKILKRILILVLLFIIFYIVITIKISKPLILFNTRQSEDRWYKEINNVKGNQEYSFTFSIHAISNYGDIFSIYIEERDQYLDYITAKKIEFGNFKGEKEIQIITNDNTKNIYIYFQTTKTDDTTKLEVNQLKINNKEVILEYKYLPTNVINRIKSISLNTKSFMERYTFYKDATKIMKDNYFLGIGGDCWKYKYTEYQEYNYTSSEVHSYPIQVLLEFGIISFVVLILIIIILIKILIQAIQHKDNMLITIIFATSCLFLHSIIDFDMSYFYIILITYCLMAIISTKSNLKVVTEKCSNVINILLIFISVIILLNNIAYGVYSINIEHINKKTSVEQYKIFNFYKNIMPYIQDNWKYLSIIENDLDKQIKDHEYLMKNEKYLYSDTQLNYYIYSCIEKYENDQLIDKIMNIMQYYEDTKMYNKFESEYQLNRFQKMLELANIIEDIAEDKNSMDLENICKDIYLHLSEEIYNKKEYILDSNKGRFSEDNLEKYQLKLTELEEIVNKKINHQ